MNILTKLVKIHDNEICYNSITPDDFSNRRFYDAEAKEAADVIINYRNKIGCSSPILKMRCSACSYYGYNEPNSINFISSIDVLHLLDIEPTNSDIKGIYQPIIYITNVYKPVNGVLILETDKLLVYAVGGRDNKVDCIIYSDEFSFVDMAKVIVKDDSSPISLNELYINNGYYRTESNDYYNHYLQYLIESKLTQTISPSGRANTFTRKNIDFRTLIKQHTNANRLILISKYVVDADYQSIYGYDDLDTLPYYEKEDAYNIITDDSPRRQLNRPYTIISHLKIKGHDGEDIKWLTLTEINYQTNRQYMVLTPTDSKIEFNTFIKLIADELLKFTPKGI